MVRALRASRASATTISALCLAASKGVTLMLTKRTPGSLNWVLEAVVKSEYRVPMPITRSALSAMWLPESPPVEPTPPMAQG